MKKLLIYLKGYRKETILAPLFKLLEASFELFVPLVVASIIDHGIADSDHSYVIRMCLILALLATIGLVSALTAQYFSAKAAVGFATKLRHALFCHIQSLSFTELDRIGSSTLITRMTSDINQVQTGVNLTLRLLLRSPLVVFGAMIMAFFVDARAALVFVVVIPILAVVVFLIMLTCIPLYKKVQTHLDSVLRITRENLTGNRVIRAFCKEDEEIRTFTEKNEMLTRIQEFVGKISALMNPLTFVILNFAIIALIDTGAIRVEAGLLTQGAVVALYNYMSQILVELVKLANLIINITKSIACGNRIQTLFELQPSITSASGAVSDTKTDIAIAFNHVSLRYHKTADEALSDLSFQIKKGETVGIIGGTGSGKSSLVNLIPRFYEATEGEVLVNGTNVKRYPLDALRRKIAIVPQKAVLFKGTIRENLLWGNEEATDAQMIEALSLAQGADILTKKEKGLDSEIEQGGKNLSGGQRQRLTIARALIRKAEILILDDSASALDYATEAALRQALKSITPKPTVIIVSQRTASIMHADRILVLEDGKIVGQGTHTDLLINCEIYREIYRSQFREEEEVK